MDPFGSDGELVNLHTAFIQGQYSTVLSDFSPDQFSPSNTLPVQILQYRAQCALGQQDEVIASISDSDAKSTPDLGAVRVYASYLSALSSGKDAENAVAEAERLGEQNGENLSVELLCGTVLARAGKAEQAVALLQKHQGSLDAVALLAQIHLSQNRADLAVKEAKSARSMAGDALLVNLIESWVGMRTGGEKYQQSFYVFEELAQAPSSTAATSLIAQAVSELHMGRLEEASAALDQALAAEPDNATALANKVVLETIAGRTAEAEGARKKLEASRGKDGGDELLTGLEKGREAFRSAMAKYSPKMEP